MKEDLIKLFNYSPWFTTELKDTLRHNPEYIFIPLICLYNGGAKPTEVAQLHTSDIKKYKGIWVIHFNDEDDKNLKNVYYNTKKNSDCSKDFRYWFFKLCESSKR